MSETPRESAESVVVASAPQQTDSRFSEWWKYRQLSINTLAYACFLLVLIIVGGATLVEIVARVSMATFLRSEIVSLQASLAQGGSGTSAGIVVEPPSTLHINGVPPPPTMDPPKEIDLSSVAYRQRRLTEAKIQLAKLTMLSAVGTVGYCESLWFIVHDLRSIISSSCYGSYFNAAYHTGGGYALVTLTDFKTWNDEALFLALAICSGAIGALIAGLRTVQFTLFRDLALGIASGFIVYLGMKGGRHVFLLNATEGPVLLNPYAYAFAGILVGLFTERAYALLSSLIDELEHRLRGAVAASPQNGNASPPKQPGT